jgi:hypothetical protein
MKKSFIRNALYTTAIVLLLIIGIGALAAGYSFMVGPSGDGVGISTDYLRETAPFKNYLIPGIVLFSVNGVLSTLVAGLALKRTRLYSLLILIQGCIYVGWIAIQLTMVKIFHPLHAIVASIGIVLMAIGSVLAKDERNKR